MLLATDRRVLFCGRPSAEAVEMSLSASASFDEPRRTLTVTDGDRSVSLARVDRVEGRQFVRFLGNRQDISLADRIGAPFHVEVVDPPA